jgi:hypothetical protein
MLCWTVHDVSQQVPHLVSQVAVGRTRVQEVAHSVSHVVRHDASHFPSSGWSLHLPGHAVPQFETQLVWQLKDPGSVAHSVSHQVLQTSLHSVVAVSAQVPEHCPSHCTTKFVGEHCVVQVLATTAEQMACCETSVLPQASAFTVVLESWARAGGAKASSPETAATMAMILRMGFLRL